jgi:hypothetical protein
MTHAVGFRLESLILHDGDARAKWIGDTSGTLLHHMLQLMAEEELAVGSMWIVLAVGEVDLRTPGEGECADGGGFGADVDADICKARAQSALHFGLNVARQRPSAGFGSKIDLEGFDAGTRDARLGLNRCAKALRKWNGPSQEHPLYSTSGAWTCRTEGGRKVRTVWLGSGHHDCRNCTPAYVDT